MKLVEIKESGESAEPVRDVSELVVEAMRSTVGMYTSGGYCPPWTGYLAIENQQCVGVCAFKSAPKDGRVEIAYFTFPGNEGRGVASEMTRMLIDIAKAEDEFLIIAAQTLPEESASTTVLKRNGFVFTSQVEHPEDGLVWEWQLKKGDTQQSVVGSVEVDRLC